MLNWLDFLYVFIIGYTPINNEILVDGESTFLNYNSIYTDLNFSVGVKNFYLNGAVKTTTKPLAINSYLPLQDYYSIGCSYKYKVNNKVSLNLNYTHECQHFVAAIIQNIPCHRDRFKDEIKIGLTLNGGWYKLEGSVGYLPKQGQTYIGKTYCYLFDRNSYKYYVSMDDFDYKHVRHNDFLLEASFEVEYKNFYNVIKSVNVIDYDYAESYGFGYRIYGERANIDMGVNLIGHYRKQLDKFGDMNFENNSKCEVFVKVYK
jgi:hypothetical protein